MLGEEFIKRLNFPFLFFLSLAFDFLILFLFHSQVYLGKDIIVSPPLLLVPYPPPILFFLFKFDLVKTIKAILLFPLPPSRSFLFPLVQLPSQFQLGKEINSPSFIPFPSSDFSLPLNSFPLPYFIR